MKYMKDWLDAEFERWMLTKNIEYNFLMETKLKDALTFVEPKLEGFRMK